MREVEADSVNHLDNNYYKPFFSNRVLNVNSVSSCGQFRTISVCGRSSLCGKSLVILYKVGMLIGARVFSGVHTDLNK